MQEWPAPHGCGMAEHERLKRTIGSGKRPSVNPRTAHARRRAGSATIGTGYRRATGARPAPRDAGPRNVTGSGMIERTHRHSRLVPLASRAECGRGGRVHSPVCAARRPSAVEYGGGDCFAQPRRYTPAKSAGAGFGRSSSVRRRACATTRSTPTLCSGGSGSSCRSWASASKAASTLLISCRSDEVIG